MAALGTATNVTTATHIILQEDIGAYIQGFEYAPRVAESILWTEPGKGSVVHRFPRLQSISVPSGTKAETDTFSDVAMSTSESSVTPAQVGMRMPISEEAMEGAVTGIMPYMLEQGLEAILDRMDKDGLSGSTSATNSVGATTDEFALSHFRVASATYRGLKIPGARMHALVLHEDAIRDFEESCGSTTAIYTANSIAQDMFGPNFGYKGMFQGYAVFASPNVPAEGAGWSNFMTPVGYQQSGLGMVLTRVPTVKLHEGNEGLQRSVVFAYYNVWYGCGVTNPNRLLEILSRT